MNIRCPCCGKRIVINITAKRIAQKNDSVNGKKLFQNKLEADIKKIAKKFNISVENLTDNDRKENFMMLKHTVRFYLVVMKKYNIKKVGEIFNVSRQPVWCSVKKITNILNGYGIQEDIDKVNTYIAVIEDEKHND